MQVAELVARRGHEDGCQGHNAFERQPLSRAARQNAHAPCSGSGLLSAFSCSRRQFTRSSASAVSLPDVRPMTLRPARVVAAARAQRPHQAHAPVGTLWYGPRGALLQRGAAARTRIQRCREGELFALHIRNRRARLRAMRLARARPAARLVLPQVWQNLRLVRHGGRANSLAACTTRHNAAALARESRAPRSTHRVAAAQRTISARRESDRDQKTKNKICRSRLVATPSC